MKTTWKREWPHWALLGAMFGLALWRWPLTGDKVPVHWDSSGQIDRYGGKFEGLLLLPVLSLCLYGLLLTMPRFDPGRANYSQFAKSYGAIRLAVLTLLFVLYCTILLVTAGYKIDMASVVMSSTGVLFIVMGGVMGKIRPNWFTGIRTPWTLSSKTAWVKTHRAGGWTFIVVGILQIAAGMALPPAQALTLMLTLVVTSCLGLSAYSYLMWRDADDKAPPAGTLPADDLAA